MFDGGCDCLCGSRPPITALTSTQVCHFGPAVLPFVQKTCEKPGRTTKAKASMDLQIQHEQLFDIKLLKSRHSEICFGVKCQYIISQATRHLRRSPHPLGEGSRAARAKRLRREKSWKPVAWPRSWMTVKGKRDVTNHNRDGKPERELQSLGIGKKPLYNNILVA